MVDNGKDIKQQFLCGHRLWIRPWFPIHREFVKVVLVVFPCRDRDALRLEKLSERRNDILAKGI